MKTPFDFLDRIFLINLPERTNQLMDAMYECDKIGIKPRIEVISPRKTEEEGIRQGMIEALTRGKDQRILILEDDVKFVNATNVFAKSFEQVRYDDWMILFLGVCSHVPKFKKYDNWHLLKQGYGGNGIIVNKH